MPCYKPLKGWRSRDKTENGKRSIVFNSNYGYLDMPVDVPCGQCIGCRLERSRQWAIRCVHEASLHSENCFITLTYNDQNLPAYNSLSKVDFQKFFKRLRRKYPEKKIRYFHCGEYGSKFQRPHYHAIIFGFDFDDKYHWSTHKGQKYYRSKTLEELWNEKGYCIIGDVTFESAAYVARYITKKQTGKGASEHYEIRDKDGNPVYDRQTGEIYHRTPEYTTMSRRPGIAKEWYDKFKDDVFPNDYVVLRGKEMRPPKYYEKQFEIEYPSDYAKLKYNRKNAAEEFKENSTFDRLRVREKIKLKQFSLLKRSYENEENLHN